MLGHLPNRLILKDFKFIIIMLPLSDFSMIEELYKIVKNIEMTGNRRIGQIATYAEFAFCILGINFVFLGYSIKSPNQSLEQRGILNGASMFSKLYVNTQTKKVFSIKFMDAVSHWVCVGAV
jgi:hypothetical protein